MPRAWCRPWHNNKFKSILPGFQRAQDTRSILTVSTIWICTMYYKMAQVSQFVYAGVFVQWNDECCKAHALKSNNTLSVVFEDSIAFVAFTCIWAMEINGMDVRWCMHRGHARLGMAPKPPHPLLSFVGSCKAHHFLHKSVLNPDI